jgi:hypothetical protein
MLDLKKEHVCTTNLMNKIGIHTLPVCRGDIHTMVWTIGKSSVTSEVWCLQYMKRVESTHQLSLIESNIRKVIAEIEKSIEDNQQKIEYVNTLLKQVSTHKVRRTTRKSVELIKEKRNPENVHWPKFEDTIIAPSGVVQIIDRTEPFFYNTDENLTQFNIGDIVEVSFGTGRMTWKQHKGKTVQMIVNNCRPYKFYDEPFNKLALTPLEPKWRKKDIVFVENSQRFEYLMEDLYPENRRPFNGWRTKQIDIKKVGHSNTQPMPLTSHMEVEDKTPQPNDIIIVYIDKSIRGDALFEAVGVNYYNAKSPWYDSQKYPIQTTTDKILALEVLKKDKAQLEERIKNAHEEILKNNRYLELGERLRDNDVFSNSNP